MRVWWARESARTRISEAVVGVGVEVGVGRGEGGLKKVARRVGIRGRSVVIREP